MSSPNQRRPSARSVTPRPRKIAGRASGVATPAAEEAPDAAPSPAVDLTQPEPSVEERSVPERSVAGAATGRDLRSVFAEPRLTKVLAMVGAALAVLLVAQAVWLGVHYGVHDHSASRAGSDDGLIAVPDPDRPVEMNQGDIDQGVHEASEDVVTLMSLHHERFDEDVAKAADLATASYAERYKQSAADVRDDYMTGRVDVSAKVNAASVVRANTTQLQALLFVTQWISKGTGKDRRLTLTPYRVLLTMVHTSTGWLVDDMQTK